ncbi:uncharacterized protein KY384_007360 [Bacidia gigantensis]|uniref:uncharacterized protein n=1 Tax=Bacidia gigantensis TaxID=2732470 RepID=UPI001D052532|nr:uncharacterized protein KY384_007360 [Bacidia gigantensis]KAG8528442.1 hypothetical protein KY384_007360 [Bacidia gigantensis]
MEPLIDVQVKHWMNKIGSTVSEKNTILDLDAWPRYLTFDVITDVAFGAPLGCIETAGDVGGIVENFRVGLTLAGLFMRLYPFTEWINTTWMGKYLQVRPTDKTGWGLAMRLRDQLLEQRLKELEDGTFRDHTDLLQAILDARNDDGTPIELERIKADLFLILMAGADTAGTAIQSIVRLTVTNQPVYLKMIAEIDKATEAGDLSAMPQYDEIVRHCPYYIACVKEALRLYPSAPNLFARVAPPEGLVIEGMNIPGGTQVTCCAWITGRDEALFGPDAHVFRPERWLESAEKVALYEKYSFVWGYGTRVCLGKEIALMELYKAPFQVSALSIKVRMSMSMNADYIDVSQFIRAYDVEFVTEGFFASRAGVGAWEDFKIRVRPRTPGQAVIETQ